MSSVPTLSQAQEQVSAAFRERGGLGAILIDFDVLARIERNFGGATYQALVEKLEPLLDELRQQFRSGDVLAWDERQGDRLMLFLTDRRENEGPLSLDSLRRLADRVEEQIVARLGRLTLPYQRERPSVQVGYGFALYSPYESAERQMLRLAEDAQTTAQLRAQTRAREQRESLIEIIHNRNLWTVFQPILEIESRQALGHEALSRGPRGTDLEPPNALFGLAARHGLTEELERACRYQGFRDWELFGAPTRLFLNTVPATVRDTSFLGRGLLDYLGPNLSPSSVTLEITERQIIENLSLFRDAMHSFIELGFTFAIDDVGAGYSGLETISRLGASYLKVDLSLIRGIHERRVNRQIVKAILEMGHGVGATVIAEGIETVEEAAAVQDLGIRYGQGYLWGRPHDPHARRPRVVAAGGGHPG